MITRNITNKVTSKIHNIVKNNNYFKKYKLNNKKNIHSLSYLIDNKYILSHSDCIKLGFALEKILVDIILEFNTNLINIKQKNFKNKSERDHVFLDEKNKSLFYSEIKSNLNLDTEKSKVTSQKCLKIIEELKNEYPNYKIRWCLLGLRYYDVNMMNKRILSKFKVIENNIYGINNYLQLLNISYIYFNNEDEYRVFINYIVESLLQFSK